MADPLLRLLQFLRAGSKLPEKALDHPPPEQEHHRSARCNTDPAVQESQQPAVSRHIQGHDGDEGQRRKDRLHHCQQDGRDRAKALKTVQQRFPVFQRAQLVEPIDERGLHVPCTIPFISGLSYAS